MYKKECIICGETFEANRRDTKYCSQKCRNRGGCVTKKPKPYVPNPHAMDTMTPNQLFNYGKIQAARYMAAQKKQVGDGA